VKALPVLIALAFTAPAAAGATESYRSVMPDGSVRYGEAPEPAAKTVRKIPAPPNSTGTVVVRDEEKRKPPNAAPQGGVGVVLPPTPRESPRLAPAGQLAAPGTLPKRAAGY